jgi:PAS domain S-box-containing protein
MSAQDSQDDAVFRVLVEESIQGILIHRDMQPLFVNESWARIHGYSSDEVQQLPSILPFLHPDEHDRMLGYMQIRLAGDDVPSSYEYRGVHRDGTTIWLENHVRRIEWNGEPAVLATIVDVTDRKRTQFALRESEELFRSGFEHGPMGLFFVDKSLKILRANRAFVKLIGYSETELVGMTTSALTIEEPLVNGFAEATSTADTTLDNFDDFTTRKQYRRKDGAVLWVRVSAHWILNSENEPQYRMTLVEDITERVEGRIALEVSERRFRNLVEGSIQGILVHRHDRPMFVNDAWCQIMGYTSDEVLAAESTLNFIAPVDRDRLVSFRANRLGESETGDSPARYEYQGQRKDGSLVWLENSVRVVEWDGETAIQSTILDCTERKLREKELETFNEELEARVARRTSELKTTNQLLEEEVTERKRMAAELSHSQALYESLVETIPLCVARKNLDGEFVFVNRALRHLFGKSLEEIVGRTDYDFSPSDLADKYQQDDRRVIETGEQLDFVETIELGEQTRHIHTLKTPIHDANGTIYGTQLIFWDITDQVVADQGRQKAQEELEVTNRDLRMLLYVISHDLKEPLRAIQSFAMLVNQRAAEQLDERSQDFLTRVVDSSNRMHQLLDDVLMLSRAQRTVDPTAKVDLEVVVRDVLIQLDARVEETAAQIEIESPLPIIHGDRRWLTQALQNLLVNALKFTVEGRAPQISVVSYRNEGLPGLAIADRGPGVEEKHAERFFDLFQRAVSRKIEGTGAGLAIVRQVAERHGGKAFVLAREGGGSRFVITFGSEFVDQSNE